MIEINFTEDPDMPEYPKVTLHIQIDDIELTWHELMKVLARQLPKLGYLINTNDLEDAIDDCAAAYRGKLIYPAAEVGFYDEGLSKKAAREGL